MTTLRAQLIALGFAEAHPLTMQGDFILQDNSDGAGVRIGVWLSPLPCPFAEMMVASDDDGPEA